MNRFFLLTACCVLSLGCYTPRGAFLEVDESILSEGGDYRIGPGDVLQVRVFQQDSMSARVKVRADGRVSLPLVNDVLAAGKAPTALASELQVKLKDFINNPVVTVSLEESRPMVVSVLGEVAKPGVVTLDPGAGVLQALAACGGLTDFAHRDGIFVLRKTPKHPEPRRIRFLWEALSRGEGVAARFVLQPGDVVVAE